MPRSTHRRYPLHLRRLHLMIALAVLLPVLAGGARVWAQADPAALAPATPSAVEAARAAVVRIEVEGDYRLPYAAPGRTQAASGSGFFVAADGTLVTNAHVAIRGATYKLYFDGSVKPVEATLRGVSECSDLAVLDAAGDGYPSLAWRTEPVARDDAVFAAGYPGGVFDLVLTSGAVRAIERDDQTEWASVGSVVNHTATTNPGSSGGPLLDAAGQVAGVVFAESGLFASRNYAIAADESAALATILRGGDSAESIGITAEALADDAALPGVWVVAVQPASPAARAGLLPGDIIRKLGNRSVGRDGTLATYCSILRRDGNAGAIALEVYRPDTGQVFEGTLNGAALTPTGAFDAALVPTATPVPQPTALPTPRPGDFQEVSDETGILTVRVPAAWNFVESNPSRIGTVVFSPWMVVAGDGRAYEADRAPFVQIWAIQRDARAAAHAADFFADAAAAAHCAARVSPLASSIWDGEVHAFDACPGLAGTQTLATVLTPTRNRSVSVYIYEILPPDTPHFALTTLIEPLAASLLPRLPFWEPPRATVQVDGLNVRTGPGTENSVITTLRSGEQLPVLGKDSTACNWLYFYFSNLDGWSNAAPQYLTIDRPCAEIAVITPEEIAAFKAEGN